MLIEPQIATIKNRPSAGRIGVILTRVYEMLMDSSVECLKAIELES